VSSTPTCQDEDRVVRINCRNVGKVRAGIALSAAAVAIVLTEPAQARMMSYLDNGAVRVGVDLHEGGVITFVSRSNGTDADNVVNDHDFGRQVQQSYYAGPEGLGIPCPSFGTVWNPIGTGDCRGHPSTVLASSNDGRTIYVKSRPLQWAFDNVACECTFEQWISLDGPAVLVRNRLENGRADHTLYPAMDQELPAVYTVGRLPRLVTYSGSRPWTGGALTTVSATLPGPAAFVASEHWAAHVDGADFGLGIFSRALTSFTGGFHGTRGVGGPFDDNTGYISPVRKELLDWNIVYDYDYALVLGTVAEIRAYAQAHRPDDMPRWEFTSSREGFWYVNASDAGFPIRDVLRVTLDRADPQIWSPPSFWHAEDVPAIDIRMALHGTDAREAEVFWAGLGGDFSGTRRAAFAVVADGQFHTYRVELARSPLYRGVITRLRLDPIVGGEAAGAYAEIDSISVNTERRFHVRALTLSLRRGFARGRIDVRDAYAPCLEHQVVVVERRKAGWRRVGSASSDPAGAYRIAVRGRGSFRARLLETVVGEHTCSAAVSPVRSR
jgi:hypothetical protein